VYMSMLSIYRSTTTQTELVKKKKKKKIKGTK